MKVEHLQDHAGINKSLLAVAGGVFRSNRRRQ